MTENKTSWVGCVSDKIYLSAIDIPNTGLIVTIKSAKKELVSDPKRQDGNDSTKPYTEELLVIYFEEKNVKPMICNVTNAKAIVKATGQKFIEDTIQFKIKLTPSVIKMYNKTTKEMENVDCIRVATVKSTELMAALCSEKQMKILTDIATQVGVNLQSFHKDGIKANDFDKIKAKLEVKLAEKNVKVATTDNATTKTEE